MTLLTSVASWLMLDPTSPAPMRITMLFGSRADAWPWMAVSGLAAPTWVRFFCLRRAMAIDGYEDLVFQWRNGSFCSSDEWTLEKKVLAGTTIRSSAARAISTPTKTFELMPSSFAHTIRFSHFHTRQHLCPS